MSTVYGSSIVQARMVLILPEYSQRPYRYGMTLLCIGAMFNWLGLAENNAEPVRYIGVTLIAAGAMLICLAMCFWMKASHDPAESSQSEEPIHHIVTIHQSGASLEKPPDYDSVTGCLPPCYEDAIRLNPSLLLPNISSAQDLTDSRKQDAIIPPSVSPQSSNNIPAPPYSQSCTIDIPIDLTSTKNVDVVDGPKSTTNDSVTAPSELTTSNVVDESSQNSSQNNDNFGSKVLRLSMRLLRGRQRSQDGEGSGNMIVNTILPPAGISTPQLMAADLPPYELTMPLSSTVIDNDSSSPSTSNLPVR